MTFCFRRSRFGFFAWMLFAGVWMTAAPACIYAQEQESGMMHRIMHPDMNMTYNPADKQFGGTSSFQGKTAPVRAFNGARSAVVKPYLAKGFLGQKGFGLKSFAGRDRKAATKDAFSQSGKTFGTRAMPVRGATDAAKTYAVRDAGGERPFLVRGQKQDIFDEQSHAKPMSIDDVRELLNKSR